MKVNKPFDLPITSQWWNMIAQPGRERSDEVLTRSLPESTELAGESAQPDMMGVCMTGV